MNISIIFKALNSESKKDRAQFSRIGHEIANFFFKNLSSIKSLILIINI